MTTGKQHRYSVEVRWTGNRGSGTADYRSYSRDHEIRAGVARGGGHAGGAASGVEVAHDEGADKPVILGSSDPAFRGDPARYNPEELLVASLSQCHLLWYLHLCAVGGVVVLSYVDHPEGTMSEDADGGGRFTDVVLRPSVDVAASSMVAPAEAMHDEAHRLCFIANSVNFPVRHEPTITVVGLATPYAP